MWPTVETVNASPDLGVANAESSLHTSRQYFCGDNFRQIEKDGICPHCRAPLHGIPAIVVDGRIIASCDRKGYFQSAEATVHQYFQFTALLFTL